MSLETLEKQMKERIVARTLPVGDLTAAEKQAMFHVFEKYYDGVDYEQFLTDLSNKNDVILLIDKVLKEVKGFCTLYYLQLDVGGETARGVFTGDTVLEKRYWGQKALNRAFSAYLWTQKIKNPFSPLYWFLISKGYKTYLCLTNNIPRHYPRFDREMPEHHKKIMDAFGKKFYPDDYNPNSGVVEFQDVHEHLCEDVAPITEELRKTEPQIDFFAETNPGWSKGHELVCLGEYDLDIPLRFVMKTVKKSTKRQIAGSLRAARKLLEVVGGSRLPERGCG